MRNLGGGGGEALRSNNVNPDAQPRFYKARSVPLIHKEKLEQELDELQRKGVISPV